MPVATKGAVKTLSPHEVEELGYEIILSNTYHLIEKPGIQEIKSFGGLHNYIGWRKPILTDSGGYQVFSLHRLVKIQKEGVVFRSLLDGREIRATPESVIQWQREIGSDVSMVLDVCTPYGVSRKAAEDAVIITTEWAKRSMNAWKEGEPSGRLIFGIVQGNFFRDLRSLSASQLIEMDFDGFAAGGLSVGEPKELMFEMSDLVAELLPEEKPRYFMGLGDPPSILRAISQGYDMFDSALSTRIARGGSFFTKSGTRNIRNSAFKGARSPIVEECRCFTCTNFSSGFIRHLYLSEETLALRLLTIHNLHFLSELMKSARKAIKSGDFYTFMENFVSEYGESIQ